MAEPTTLDDERSRLTDERSFLLASLDDLESERAAGDLTDDDYLALRAGYERRAVDLLAALAAEGTEPEEDTERVGAPSSTSRRRRARRALVALAVAGTALGAGLAVDGTAGNRLPTQTITGSLPPAIGNELVDAQADLVRGDELQALKLFEAVLAAQPDEPEALASSGWIVANAGVASGNKALLARGIASINAAIKADPSYPDAYLLLGLTNLGSGDPHAAVGELRRYLALGPSAADAQVARSALAKAEAEAEAASTPSGAPAPPHGQGPTTSAP